MSDKDEEPKALQAPKAVDDHSNDSDFALALALQNQESVFTLESSESESEEVSDDDQHHNICNYHRFPDSQGQLDFLENEDSDSDEDMEEDDIDPDELSYEELIALGEMVGEESKGLSSVDEISSCLHPPSLFHFPPPHHHSKNTLVDRCVICQVEYEEGEAMVGLIPCDHPYHLDCITKWLQIRKICPICSTEVTSAPKIAQL